ncbi:MAG: GNAT family N-acetyltransferase [Armatimonas sp.]
MSLEIRAATVDDAAAICEVHLASIRTLCARDYSPEQIDAWCEGKSPADYVNAIECGGNLVVAVVGGAVIGFGGIYLQPPVAEVKAVYVHPEATGQGAGRGILEALEVQAMEAGCAELSLPASLTAQRFYANNGYIAGEPVPHRFANGVEILCIPMTKTIENPSKAG